MFLFIIFHLKFWNSAHFHKGSNENYHVQKMEEKYFKIYHR